MADDQLESLMRPGPHCYGSGAEMAAARQRALTVTDRMRWELDFAQRWEEEHRTPVEYPVTMIPPNSPITVPAPPIPSITGPNGPGVPPSRDPNLSVSDDVCFGVTKPLD